MTGAFCAWCCKGDRGLAGAADAAGEKQKLEQEASQLVSQVKLLQEAIAAGGKSKNAKKLTQAAGGCCGSRPKKAVGTRNKSGGVQPPTTDSRAAPDPQPEPAPPQATAAADTQPAVPRHRQQYQQQQQGGGGGGGAGGGGAVGGDADRDREHAELLRQQAEDLLDMGEVE